MPDLPAAWLSLPRRAVLGASAAGVGLLLVPAAAGSSLLVGICVWGGLACLAAAAAYLMDEPAAEVVRATPHGVGRWQTERLAVVLAPCVLGVAALGVVSARFADVSWRATGVQLAGLLVVTVAVAAIRSPRTATPGAHVAEVTGLLIVITGLVDPLGRWVDVLVLAENGRWHRTVGLWLGLTLLGVVALQRARRDPMS